MAGTTLTMLPVILVFLLFQKKKLFKVLLSLEVKNRCTAINNIGFYMKIYYKKKEMYK